MSVKKVSVSENKDGRVPVIIRGSVQLHDHIVSKHMAALLKRAGGAGPVTKRKRDKLNQYLVFMTIKISNVTVSARSLRRFAGPWLAAAETDFRSMAPPAVPYVASRRRGIPFITHAAD